MRGMVFCLVGVAVAACGGDTSTSNVRYDGGTTATIPDRIVEACGKITDAACAKYVECHATVAGTAVTAAFCSQNRARVVDSCRRSQGDNLAAATDGDVDACATELSQVVCSEICNRVPADPPTCRKISPDPNTQTVTCSP